MKKIIILIAAIISFVTAEAQEFTLEFNYAELIIGDSLVKEDMIHNTIIFNYKNEEGIVKLKIFNIESVLKPVEGITGELNGIEYRKMETDKGEVIIVGLDIKHNRAFLMIEAEGDIWTVILSQTNQAETIGLHNPRYHIDFNERKLHYPVFYLQKQIITS
jgi:hypothetical protein